MADAEWGSTAAQSSDARPRSAQLSLRLQPSELERIRSAALVSGQTVATFVRSALHEKCRTVEGKQPDIAEGVGGSDDENAPHWAESSDSCSLRQSRSLGSAASRLSLRLRACPGQQRAMRCTHSALAAPSGFARGSRLGGTAFVRLERGSPMSPRRTSKNCSRRPLM